MAKVTREFSDFAARTRYEDLSTDVINQAKRVILDAVGVALASWKDDYLHTEGAKKITAFAKKFSGKRECTILGARARANRFSAALANGTIAKLYGQDETYRFSGGGHIAAPLVPAALTAAELEGTDGKRLIVSVVVGYDIFARALEAFGRSHGNRGFWSTQTLGTLAAAVATGKIYGFNSRQISNAIGLATNLSSGLLEFVYTANDILGLSSGWSCQNGLLASELAREGFIGPEAPLEGNLGLFRAMADQPSPVRMLDNLGEEYLIMKAGFKLRSGCRHTHPSTDAVIKILKENEVAPENVKKIIVRTYSSYLSANTEPNNLFAAVMSLPCNMALLFFDRKLGPDHFDMFKASAVRRLSKKVEIVTDTQLDQLYPEKMGAKVEVVTTSGKKFSNCVDYPRGEPENPLTENEMQAKFRRLASLAISKKAVESLMSSIQHLEKVKNVKEIIELLRP